MEKCVMAVLKRMSMSFENLLLAANCDLMVEDA